MFDLFRSREKMIRILLGALLGLVALSMLTYLIPNYSDASVSGDQVIADVGNTQISASEVQLLVQNTMRARQVPAAMLPTYVPQMVDEMITDRALEYQAQRLGFQVSDDDLSAAIRQTVPSLFQDGKFVGRDAYAAMLAQQNMTIPLFENDLRRQLLVTRLREVAVEGTVVSQAEVELEYRKRNAKLKVEYVKLTLDKFRNEVQVSPADIKQFYDANIARFQVPERRNLTILVADPAHLEQTLTAPEAELKRVYSQNPDQFRTPDRVKVRHILLTTTGGADEAKVKAKADDLLKQIRAGGSFADLAKKNSQDPGSASSGGDLPDWVTRGQTVPEFEQVAFTLPIGQTSNLVKTQYGYHIIQVLAKEQAHLRTFDEAKGDLAAQWKKQRASDLMQQVSDKAQAELQKDPAHPEKVAAEYNLQVVHANEVGSNSAIPDIGPSKDFDDSIANLKKGEASPAVSVSNNKVVLAVVTDVLPAHPQPLAEVQDRVKESIVENRLGMLLPQKAKELLAKANSMGGDLKKAAQSISLDTKVSDEFTRLGSPEGLGSASYLQDGFDRPVGTVFGPVLMPDATVVAKVLAHIDPDMSKLSADRNAIRDELKTKKARDRNSLFEAGVRAELTKAGKIKVHKAVLDRILSAYKG